MGKSVELIDKRDAVKVIEKAKSSANKLVDDFYYIKGDKNTIKHLPFHHQKEIQSYIGNKPVNIILWKN